jgi:hypothetical protein
MLLACLWNYNQYYTPLSAYEAFNSSFVAPIPLLEVPSQFFNAKSVLYFLLHLIFRAKPLKTRLILCSSQSFQGSKRFRISGLMPNLEPALICLQ